MHTVLQPSNSKGATLALSAKKSCRQAPTKTAFWGVAPKQNVIFVYLYTIIRQKTAKHLGEKLPNT